MTGRFAPDFAEAWYSRGLFQGIRRLLDGITGILPFPAVYLLVAGGMGIWGIRAYGYCGAAGWYGLEVCAVSATASDG